VLANKMLDRLVLRQRNTGVCRSLNRQPFPSQQHFTLIILPHIGRVLGQNLGKVYVAAQPSLRPIGHAQLRWVFN